MTTPTGPELPDLRLVRHLGSGGHSDVFLYERLSLRLNVAVKLLRSDVLTRAQLRQFSDEAEVMAELNDHPNIVPVLDTGTAPDGRPYIVMKYYSRPDMGKRVRDKPLSVREALRTGVQLASAVETAHRADILHRDVKPANILMSTYDVPALGDFGIAGRTAETTGEEDIGLSVPWAAPEVIAQSSNGSIASDVYSLSATIWNLLVGHSPFWVQGANNDERSMLTRILHTPPPATGLPGVPPELDRLLQQAMAKKPELRPRRAIDLARSLSRIEQQLNLPATEIWVLDLDAESLPATTVRSALVPPAPSLSPEETPRPGSIAPPMDDAPAARTRLRGPARVAATQPESTEDRGRTESMAVPWVAATVQKRPVVVSDPAGGSDTTVPDAPAGRSRRPVIVTAVALLVAVTGIGAIIASSRNAGPRESPAVQPGATPPDAGELLPGSLEVPSPAAQVRGDRVVVSWPKPSGAVASDRYEYLAYRLPDLPDLQTADAASTTRTMVSIRSRRPDDTCVVVRYVHLSNYSDWSAAVGGANCG